MKTGAEIISEERQRQIDAEGYTQEHDMHHTVVEFVNAAMAYLAQIGFQPENGDELSLEDRKRLYAIKKWPWEWQYFKPENGDVMTCLRKAGGLIAAAIDRYENGLIKEEE